MVMSHQQAPETSHSAQQRSGTDEFNNKVAQLMNELRIELDALGRESAEIELLLRQTHMEVEKLANRELAATNRVRDMELNLDNYSRHDMKTIYNSAHEIQMRLFMMRAQVEQLEAKRNSMKILQSRLQRFSGVLMSAPEGFNPGAVAQNRMTSASLIPMSEAQATEAGSNAPAHANGSGTGGLSNKQLVSQIIQTQEAERLRVSRQIHDGPAQTMTNLVLRAEICERLLDMDPSRAKAELSGLKSVVNSTLQETRRFIFDLRPMILDDLGLEPTLRRYVQQFVEKHKLEVGVVINNMSQRLPNEIEVALFRIVQEALENVSKHAHAKHAQINLDHNGETVSVTVEDDGAGFNPDELKGKDPKRKGLATTQQRVDMFGGKLNIDSSPGRGTKLTVNLPAEWGA
jgi:two-component system, NarL family, sensor histidine kinase DegS